MRSFGMALLLVMLVLATAAPALAQPEKTKDTTGTAVTTATNILHGAPIGAGLVIIGAAFGFGRIGAAALEGMARQPEAAGRIQPAMIIIAALLEGATFFALLVCLIS